jgi:hypothetical protein
MIEAFNREVQGLDDVELWIHTCWGNPNMQRAMEDTSYAKSIDIYLERRRGDVWTLEMKDRDQKDLELFEPLKHDFKKKNLPGRCQPSHVSGGSAGRRRRRGPQSVEVHPAQAPDRVERLWLWASGLQPRESLSTRRPRSHKAAISCDANWGCL